MRLLGQPLIQYDWYHRHAHRVRTLELPVLTLTLEQTLSSQPSEGTSFVDLLIWGL